MSMQELNITDESYRDWEINNCPSEATVKARRWLGKAHDEDNSSVMSLVPKPDDGNDDDNDNDLRQGLTMKPWPTSLYVHQAGRKLTEICFASAS